MLHAVLLYYNNLPIHNLSIYDNLSVDLMHKCIKNRIYNIKIAKYKNTKII